MRTDLEKPVSREESRSGGRRTGRLVALVVLGLVCLVPGVGFVRERHDNRVKQRMYRERREALERGLSMLREGDPASRLQELLPEPIKRPIKSRDRVIFNIVTAYDETPAFVNMSVTRWDIRVADDMVTLIKRDGGGLIHMDRFETGGPWYYFKRAWWSSQDSDDFGYWQNGRPLLHAWSPPESP